MYPFKIKLQSFIPVISKGQILDRKMFEVYNYYVVFSHIKNYQRPKFPKLTITDLTCFE